MTNAPTTNDAGTSQSHAMSIPFQDLLDKAEGFIIAVDHIAGKQMESGPAGYYWGLALRLTGSTRPDSRLAGCIFALRALRESSAIVDSVPGLLAQALATEHGAFDSIMLSDEVIVDVIPILAAFLGTPEGKEQYAQIQRDRQAA